MRQQLLHLLLLALSNFALQGQTLELQFGHHGPINSVAFSPDGKHLITAGQDGQISEWTLEGLEIRRFMAKEEEATPFFSVEYSQNGEHILASQSSRALLFSRKGELRQALESPQMHGQAHISPEGKTITLGAGRNPIRIFSLEGEEIGSYPAGNTSGFVYLPARGSVAVASAEAGLKLIDIKTRKLLKSLSPRITPSNNRFAIDPKGEYLAVANAYGVSLVQLVEGELSLGPTVAGKVGGVTYTSDGELLLVAHGNVISAFDREGNSRWKQKVRSSINDLKASPTQPNLFAIALENGAAQLWTTFGQAVTTYRGYAREWVGIGLAPNGKTLACVNQQGEIQIWDLSTQQIIHAKHGAKALSFATSPKGNYFTVGGQDGQASIWDWTGKQVAKQAVSVGNKESPASTGVVSLAFTNSEKFLFTGDAQKIAAFWPLEGSESPAKEVPPLSSLSETPEIQSVALSNDGELYFVARAPKPSDMSEALAVWNNQGQYLRSFDTEDAQDIALNPSATTLLTGGSQGMQLFNVNTGKQLSKISRSPASCVAMSPDEQWYAGGQENGVIHLQNAQGEAWTLKGHRGKVNDLSFSPSSDRLFSASTDGSIRVWSLSNKEEVAALIPQSGHTEEYAIVLPDLRYATSQHGIQSLLIREDQVEPLRHRALKLHRPQEVYAQLGYMHPTAVSLISQAHEQRMEELKASEQQQTPSPNAPVPTLSLIPEEFLSITQSPRYPIYATAKSDASLASYNTFVNGMPKHQFSGRSLWGRSLEFTEELYLPMGLNRIEVVLTNEKGKQCRRGHLVYYQRDNPPSPTLHLVTIGASKYDQEQYNLPYALKGAEALEALVEKQLRKSFGDIETYSLSGEEATKANIQALRAKLERTFLHDIILVYYAGHGLIGADQKYYLSTRNTNFDAPYNASLAYNELEELLYNLPAKHKALLLDLTHSDTAALASTEQSKRAVQPLEFGQPKGVKSEPATPYQIAPLLFQELRSPIGVEVVALSSKLSYAQAQAESLLIRALEEGTQQRRADYDRDRMISLNEALDYITQTALEQNQGRMRSMGTLSSENAENILFWR